MFRFGIVGLGYIGKRHLSLLSEIPEVEIVAVCDTQTKIQHELPKPYQPLFYPTIEELLEHSSTDVICVCTPNGVHAQHSLMAIEANNHVICEKPLGLNALSCIEILETAQRKQKNIICVLQNRFTPTAIWLKELAESGKLGQVYQIQVNCFWNRDQRYYQSGSWRGTLDLDGGPLYTQFSHFLDILFWAFGQPTTLQYTQFRDYNHQNTTTFEDSGSLLFTLHSGADVQFHYSTSVWDKNLESSITVIAEKGSFKIGGQYLNEVSYCHIQDYIMPELACANPPNQYPGFQGSASNHQAVFQDMLKRLSQASVDYQLAIDAIETVAFIEKIYERRAYQAIEQSFFNIENL